MKKRPFVLIVMDGFGLRSSKQGNAIALAKKPNLDYFFKHHAFTELKASGNAVGLPEGFMGNSEVGHYTIGAGRIIWQDLERINREIRSKTFFKNPVLRAARQHVKRHKSVLHVMGLLSDGGVHAQLEHLFALLEWSKRQKIDLVVHCFTDGRDMAPHSTWPLISKLEKKMAKLKTGRIGSIIGRYYAMDRDHRWMRTHKAYKSLTEKGFFSYPSAKAAIDAAYARGEGDEFIYPSEIQSVQRRVVRSKDAIIFLDSESERPGQLTRAFTERQLAGFKRKPLNQLFFACFAEYGQSFKLPVVFPSVIPKKTLGELFSEKGWKQLRVAETEKYAHVTYFFNGGVEKPFRGEDRILIPSPKVSTYDQVPEMSGFKITETVIKALEKGVYDFILVNFANCDMVGHTGKLKETIQAVEVVDKCIGRIVGKTLEKGGKALITADHGNAELKWFKGQPSTAHTTNPVPCCLIGTRYPKLKKGGLADVAATVLKALGLKKPRKMTGKALC